MRKLPQFTCHPLQTPATILKNKKDLSSKDVTETRRSMEFIHLILDSYNEMWPKKEECVRRTDSTTIIDIIGMNRDTPIPQQFDTFWATENKLNSQLLFREMLCHHACGNATTITSSLVSEILPATSAGGEEIRNS